MRIIRFMYQNKPSYGIVENKTVYICRGDINTGLEKGEEIGDIDSAKLLVPCQPANIIGHGLNYKGAFKQRKIDFFKEPIRLFMKPTVALVGPMDNIVLPPHSNEVVYEAELVIVIGRKAKNVNEDEADKYIFGYTCGNDVTAWDLQKKDGWPVRAKSFDTFAPVGPVIVTDLDTSDLTIKSRVNGKIIQNSRTSDMLFFPPRMISYISTIFTLLPGDIIFTGSPPGWSPLKAGDEVEIEIENIGVLKNFVV